MICSVVVSVTLLRMCVLLPHVLRPLHKEVMQDRVSFICGKEGVQLDNDAFDLLAQVGAHRPHTAQLSLLYFQVQV